MDEKHVLLTADFYNETRTWRNELILAGHTCVARISANDILWVEKEGGAEGWSVSALVLGDTPFRVAYYHLYGDETVELDTAEEVMTFISESIRNVPE